MNECGIGRVVNTLAFFYDDPSSFLFLTSARYGKNYNANHLNPQVQGRYPESPPVVWLMHCFTYIEVFESL